MKASVIIPAFSLFCGISAYGNQDSYPTGALGSNFPFKFDKKTTNLSVKFGELAQFYDSDGQDPLDTFIFYLSTPKDARDKQNLVIDVTNLRSVVANLTLSISGCDGKGLKCFPDLSPNSNVPRPFQAINNTDNTTTLNTKFAGGGQYFFVYLQIQNTIGKDNAARPLSDAPHSDAYNQLVNYNKPEDVAITIRLNV